MAVKPTARTLTDYFLQKAPTKIKEMRMDTLSQMMTAGNIRSGSRYLTVDDMGGLLVASLMERMQGNGRIINFGEHEHNCLEIYKYLNLPAEKLKLLQHYPWFRLTSRRMSVCLL